MPRVKIRNSLWGVTVWLDGVEVKDLVSAHLSAEVDDVAMLTLKVLPSEIDVEVDADVQGGLL